MGCPIGQGLRDGGFAWGPGISVGLMVMVAQPIAAAAAERSVALLPVIASGKSAPELRIGAEEAIGQVAKTWLAVELIAGDELNRRLRGSGAKQAAACQSEPACLAKLGRRLKVDEIGLVTVRPSGDGARLTFLIVGVADRRVRRTVSVSSERAAGLEVAVFEQWHMVLGVERSALTRRPAPVADDLVMLELAPMPDLTPIVPPPSNEPRPTGPTVAEVAAAPIAGEAAATSAEPSLVAVLPPPPSPAAPSAALWVVGWGLAGAGAAVLGVSGYYGLRYEAKKGAIDADGYLTTPLPRALKLQRQANDARRTGILLAMIGSAVTVAGGALVVVDLATGVEVTTALWPGGASAAVSWVW